MKPADYEALLELEKVVRDTHGDPSGRGAPADAISCPECLALLALDEARNTADADELEKLWPDDDRRGAALERVQAAIDHSDETWPKTVEGHADLTPQQIRVLEAASVGLNRVESSIVLGCSLESVKHHLKHARHALGAKTTTHAVAVALRRGLIQ